MCVVFKIFRKRSMEVKRMVGIGWALWGGCLKKMGFWLFIGGKLVFLHPNAET